jgi:hypothetical protein
VLYIVDGYDPVDEEELEGLAKDTETDPSPVNHNEPEAEGAPEEGQDEGHAPAVSSDESTVETESSVRRSSRQHEAAAPMNIGSTKGQSYVQKKKVVVQKTTTKRPSMTSICLVRALSRPWTLS